MFIENILQIFKFSFKNINPENPIKILLSAPIIEKDVDDKLFRSKADENDVKSADKLETTINIYICIVK